MSDHPDPPPSRDLIEYAKRILDDVEAADDDEALEPLGSLHRRAVETVGQPLYEP